MTPDEFVALHPEARDVIGLLQARIDGLETVVADQAAMIGWDGFGPDNVSLLTINGKATGIYVDRSDAVAAYRAAPHPARLELVSRGEAISRLWSLGQDE